MYISNSPRRSDAVFLFFYLFLAFCIGRLLFIQFFRSTYLAGLAQKQHNMYVELEPRRGTIYDRNLRPQAVNLPVDSLYASPSDIKNKEGAIQQLSSILGLDAAYLRERLSRKKSFVWLARKISADKAQTVKALNMKGLGFLKESKRSYHNGYLASQIMGFAGLDNKGLEGLEGYFDAYLKGEPGWAVYLRDARQRKLGLWEKMAVPRDGYNLVLTIDEVIQYIAERELDKAYRTYNAKGASIIVMDPHTGAILAMANRPTFDLNNYARASKDQIRNRAICDLFEPGSVFKIVTASAALQENKAKEEDTFFCENGEYKFLNHTLHDHTPHGVLTFRQVIEESSNIGTAKIAQLLGPDLLYKYIRLFGFGAKLGVDAPGEVSGIIREPRFWSKISIVSVPMGQEVAATALQLVGAISVIANGGQVMKPYVVQEITDAAGVSIKKFSPTLIRKAISIDTASRIRSILSGVVEEGTGKLAKPTGFSAAGKTGTAQKLEANGTYSHSKFVASFIGFAPAEDPLVAIAVCVDEPHPYYYGGVVAAPVFKNVATDVIRYLKSNASSQSVIKPNIRENTRTY